MLQNARVTVFTVSELLRENQQGRGVKLPPPHTLKLVCARASFLKSCRSQPLLKNLNFIKKVTLAQVFRFEFCEIFKNTFFTEHIRPPSPEYGTDSRSIKADTVQNNFLFTRISTLIF